MIRNATEATKQASTPATDPRSSVNALRQASDPYVLAKSIRDRKDATKKK